MPTEDARRLGKHLDRGNPAASRARSACSAWNKGTYGRCGRVVLRGQIVPFPMRCVKVCDPIEDHVGQLLSYALRMQAHLREAVAHPARQASWRPSQRRLSGTCGRVDPAGGSKALGRHPEREQSVGADEEPLPVREHRAPDHRDLRVEAGDRQADQYRGSEEGE